MRKLERRRFSVKALHGGYDQAARFKVMAAFRTGDVKCLVATDVASRGLDVAHVTHVVNLGVPRDVSDYTHRIGRTGRAGRHGVAVTFVAGRDERVHRATTSLEVRPPRDRTAPRALRRGAPPRRGRGTRREGLRRCRGTSEAPPRAEPGRGRPRRARRERPRRRRSRDEDDERPSGRRRREESEDSERPRRRRGRDRREGSERPARRRDGEERGERACPPSARAVGARGRAAARSSAVGRRDDRGRVAADAATRPRGRAHRSEGTPTAELPASGSASGVGLAEAAAPETSRRSALSPSPLRGVHPTDSGTKRRAERPKPKEAGGENAAPEPAPESAPWGGFGAGL